MREPDAPTYRFVRGQETQPDRSQRIPPGVPALLGLPLPDIRPIDLPPSIGFGLQLWLPTPPLPASELGFLQKFTVRLRDAATQQLLDESYVYYQPR